MARSLDDRTGIHFRDDIYYHDINDIATLTVGASAVTVHSASVSVRVVSGTAGNLTIGTNQHYVGADATAANCGVVLPAASGVTGRMYTIKKLDVSANLVHISGAGTDKIWSTGSNPTAILNLKAQGQAYTLISDGYLWHVCGFFSGNASL